MMLAKLVLTGCYARMVFWGIQVNWAASQAKTFRDGKEVCANIDSFIILKQSNNKDAIQMLTHCINANV